MAAQVLARSLGLDLYRVDLAGVVNKYIGETEKHLRRVFDACERAPVLLLFDEADALFGKRTQVSDAHDRFANIEIDYLLQRMEQFDGVAVLATNRKGDLDPAFLRRLRFIIDFAAARRRRARAACGGSRWRRARRRRAARSSASSTGRRSPTARPDRRGHQVRGAGRGVPRPRRRRAGSACATCSRPPAASSRSRASSCGPASWSADEPAASGGPPPPVTAARAVTIDRLRCASRGSTRTPPGTLATPRRRGAWRPACCGRRSAPTVIRRCRSRSPATTRDDPQTLWRGASSTSIGRALARDRRSPAQARTPRRWRR